jgi:hypothetical protein
MAIQPTSTTTSRHDDPLLRAVDYLNALPLDVLGSAARGDIDLNKIARVLYARQSRKRRRES